MFDLGPGYVGALNIIVTDVFVSSLLHTRTYYMMRRFSYAWPTSFNHLVTRRNEIHFDISSSIYSLRISTGLPFHR